MWLLHWHSVFLELFPLGITTHLFVVIVSKTLRGAFLRCFFSPGYVSVKEWTWLWLGEACAGRDWSQENSSEFPELMRILPFPGVTLTGCWHELGTLKFFTLFWSDGSRKEDEILNWKLQKQVVAIVMLPVFICTNLDYIWRWKRPGHFLQDFLMSFSETIYFYSYSYFCSWVLIHVKELGQRKIAPLKSSCCLLGSPKMMMMRLVFISVEFVHCMGLGKHLAENTGIAYLSECEAKKK